MQCYIVFIIGSHILVGLSGKLVTVDSSNLSGSTATDIHYDYHLHHFSRDRHIMPRLPGTAW